MSTYPKSPKEQTGGMMYFPRMLDKIRLHARGELGSEYHPNLGGLRTADGACTNFLRVSYPELCKRVLRVAATTKFWNGVMRKGGV
jgi:gluconokinase